MSRELTRRDFLGDAALVGVASAIGIENALAGQAARAATPPRERRVELRRRVELFQGRYSQCAVAAVDRRELDARGFAARLEHRRTLQRERSRAARREPTCPPASAGTAKPSSFRASDAGRRILLQFDGVYQCSDVWINGQHLGTRPYGFIHVLLRSQSASSLWQRAERRRRARG